jgi:hypothetical protein
MSTSEEAVIVRSTMSEMGANILEYLNALEEALINVIEQECVGEFDGNEVGQGELVLYMYGPSAENLFATVLPCLRSSPLTSSAVVIVRHGGPGAACRFVRLDDH